MVAGVEMAVESDRGPAGERRGRLACAPARAADDPPRRRRALALPASRKVRALFAYLALAPHAVAAQPALRAAVGRAQRPARRAALVPSKIRGILDEPGRRRVETRGDTVRLDLADCFVDAVEIARATAAGHRDACAASGCASCAALFDGDFLDGLEIDRNPASTAGSPRSGAGSAAATRPCWSTWSRALPDDEVFGYLEQVARARARSTSASTRSCSTPSPGAAGSAKARSIWPRPPGCSRPKASIARRSATRGGPPGRSADAAPRAAVAARRRAAAASRRRDEHRHRRAPPRLHRGDAVRRPAAAAGAPRRRRRRARPRRDHPARQAAQPVRHRAGHRVRAARAAHRPGRGRPHAERRLRRQRIACGATASASP